MMIRQAFSGISWCMRGWGPNTNRIFLSVKAKTFLLCCLVAVADRADQMLLPSVYLEIGQSFDVTPSFLGIVSGSRGLATAVTSLLAGPLGSRYNRVSLIAIGSVVWGVATVCVGASTNAYGLLLARTVNGIGLGLVVPPVLALVADSFQASKRGQAFGAIGLSSNIGAAIGNFFAITLAGQGRISVNSLSVEGWRLVFYLAGAACALLGVLVHNIACDVRQNPPLSCTTFRFSHFRLATESSEVSAVDGIRQSPQTDSPIPQDVRPSSMTQSVVAREYLAIIKIRTLWVLLAQGALYEMPYYTLNYFTLWLEVSGWSHAEAATVHLCLDVGVTIGVLIGGFISDRASRRRGNVSEGLAGFFDFLRCGPGHGRIAVAQVSVAIGVVFWLVILRALPSKDVHSENNALGILSVVVFFTGLLSQWEFPSKASLMAEVTPPALTTSAFSFTRFGEGTLASLTAPLVGFLAVHEFHLPSLSTIGNDDASGSDGQHAAGSLGKAMCLTLAIPWACAVCVMGLSHFTYPKDRSNLLGVDVPFESINRESFDGQTSKSSNEIEMSSTYNPVHNS
jgi:MFS family permease